MITKMKLGQIKILPAFQACPPRAEKLEAKRAHYRNTGHYDRDLAVDGSGWLVDGYATYLVMLENHEDTVRASIATELWPAASCEDGTGKRDWYHVPMRLARKLRLGQKAVLLANGRVQVLTVRNIELFSGRPCWPAHGFALPYIRPAAGRAEA